MSRVIRVASYKPTNGARCPPPSLVFLPRRSPAMNPLVYASLTLLLTVIQAVGVDAKGKKKGSSSKPGKKLPIALIAGVVVAGVVRTCIPYYHRTVPFLSLLNS
jgi:hypothetical protein